nr:unnamed protein product [Callosobruchus analis]
MTVNMKSY